MPLSRLFLIRRADFSPRNTRFFDFFSSLFSVCVRTVLRFWCRLGLTIPAERISALRRAYSCMSW